MASTKEWDFSLDRKLAQFRSRKTEAGYQEFARGAYKKIDILGLRIGILIYALYGLLDYFVLTYYVEAISIRIFGAVGGFALLAFGPKYIKGLSVQSTAIAIMLIGGQSVNYMIWRQGDVDVPYYVGIMMIILHFLGLIRMPVKAAAIMVLSLYVGYLVATFQFVPSVGLISSHFFLLSFSIAGIGTIYFLETLKRLDFEKYKTIEIHSGELDRLYGLAQNEIERQSALLNITNHVLVTPIHQIIGFSDLLKGQISTAQSQSSEATTESVSHISRAAKSLHRQLKRLNAYTELDVRISKMGSEEIDVSLLVEDLIGDTDLELHLDMPSTVIYGDPLVIGEVLSELINNAFENCDPDNGVVSITTSNVDGNCIVEISDNGKGIDEETTKQLLRPLEEESNYLNVGQDKLSLGLKIANKIVTKLGGTLQIEQSMLGGAKLTVTLPQTTVSENSAEESAA